MTDAVQAVRHDWTLEQIKALFDLPFNDLLFQAQTTHRANFDPNAVQISTLLSIKTGACPEDCAYCPQSEKYDTGLERERLLPIEEVLEVLDPLFRDPGVAKLGQNLKYDRSVLARQGVRLEGIRFDTMLESYVFNSTGSRHDMD